MPSVAVDLPQQQAAEAAAEKLAADTKETKTEKQQDPAEQPYLLFDFAAYYLMTEYGGDPAFGKITGSFLPNNYDIDYQRAQMQGGGIRMTAKHPFGGGWFGGVSYNGFITQESYSAGSKTADTDTVHANLLDRSFANVLLNANFDDAQADFASETILLKQHFGDIVVGRRYQGNVLSGFWHSGVRLAHTRLFRDVTYNNFPDQADIELKSDMVGAGPTIGGGVSAVLWPGMTLSGSAAASALYSYFDLSRSDAYYDDGTGRTDARAVDMTKASLVPVFDASIELKQQMGRYFFSLGYTASAWIGGARTILTPSYDDVDGATTVYTVREDDLFTHGVFARAGIALGGADSAFADIGATGPGLWANSSFTLAGYYLMGAFGGDAAYGSITGTVGTDFTVSQDLPTPTGGGVRATMQSAIGGGWFAGASYNGFITNENSSIGTATSDNDDVHASLLDRTLSDRAALNGQFDSALVDMASDRISLDQHFGDLVVGRRYSSDFIDGFWHGGIRVANSKFHRDVTYQNLENGADLDRADIAFRSDMWGVGATLGGGLNAALGNGFSLSGSAAASALYSYFDLSRKDSYFEQTTGVTQSRGTSLNKFGVVPVFDASLELKAERGRYFASLGYTVTAWLGGARNLITPGTDDVDDTTSTYTVQEDDFITHGVFARAGIALGGNDDAFADIGSGPGLWSNTEVTFAGYYLMTSYGSDPAFGQIIGNIGGAANFKTSEQSDGLMGGGVRASFKSKTGGSWFTGLTYSGFVTEDKSTVGSPSVDSDAIHASLLDRALANLGVNANFDDGQADFGSDTVALKQHFGDLVFGRQFRLGMFNGFWQGGVRVASTRVERDVRYANLEADLDTADIALRSDALGAGPVIGGGVTTALWDGGTISGSASASALYSYFDLSRKDAYFEQTTATTRTRQASIDRTGVVPVFDASLELKHEAGRYFASLGYTVSAWLGGGADHPLALKRGCERHDLDLYRSP